MEQNLTKKARCQNPKCKKTYDLPKNDVDDGFCSFECWEEVNCKTPREIPVPVFEF